MTAAVTAIMIILNHRVIMMGMIGSIANSNDCSCNTHIPMEKMS